MLDHPFTSSLPHSNPFFPSLPTLTQNLSKEEAENRLSPHSIFYIENQEQVLLQSRPNLPHTDFLIVSARHEPVFQEYCYFLLFTYLKKQSHRYGIYFNPKNTSILEFKLTLYSYPHHPIKVKLCHSQEKYIVQQFCFGHSNFNFFLSWEQCKKNGLKLELEFFTGQLYSVKFQFQSLLLI